MPSPPVDRVPLPDGGWLDVRVSGRAEGTPVLLLRPLGGSMALWGELAGELARQRPVIAFDPRGDHVAFFARSGKRRSLFLTSVLTGKIVRRIPLTIDQAQAPCLLPDGRRAIFAALKDGVSDIFMVIGFGVLGYVFKKLDYPLAPLVLAMVLGDKAEDAFRQSMLLSGGTLNIFWSNPLVSSLMALALALLLSPLVFGLVGLVRKRKQDAATPHGDGSAAA